MRIPFNLKLSYKITVLCCASANFKCLMTDLYSSTHMSEEFRCQNIGMCYISKIYYFIAVGLLCNF